MRKHKDYRFPFSVVKSAIHGDADTLQKIWKDYESYVNTLCARPYQDVYGNQCYMIDQDMKDYMKSNCSGQSRIILTWIMVRNNE